MKLSTYLVPALLFGLVLSHRHHEETHHAQSPLSADAQHHQRDKQHVVNQELWTSKYGPQVDLPFTGESHPTTPPIQRTNFAQNNHAVPHTCLGDGAI
jgi:hypothetical protein